MAVNYFKPPNGFEFNKLSNLEKFSVDSNTNYKLQTKEIKQCN